MNNKQIKATDFPDVYRDLGIDTGRLGCIMLDTAPITISDIIPGEDYYYADPEDQPYTQGNVSERAPHVTVLYGLMRSGQELQKHVDAVLADWAIPTLTIDQVGFFYGPSTDYVTVIALLTVTDELKEGNARLSLLPHIDTFDEYRPHITLAYLKYTSPWQDRVEALNKKYAGTSVTAIGINYGD